MDNYQATAYPTLLGSNPLPGKIGVPCHWSGLHLIVFWNFVWVVVSTFISEGAGSSGKKQPTVLAWVVSGCLVSLAGIILRGLPTLTILSNNQNFIFKMGYLGAPQKTKLRLELSVLEIKFQYATPFVNI